MPITSVQFFIFIAASALVYYIVPKKAQWVVLLLASVAFYYFAATFYTIVYLVISTLIAYVATNCGRWFGERSRKITAVVTVAIIINIAIWFVLKGTGIWEPIAELFASGSPVGASISSNSLVASLGMGYYTLQVVGYILDCHWGKIQPQRNVLKLYLFVGFFPQLTTGPISRYEQLDSLYEQHEFSYENLTHGAQRILWGLFNKLVIAEHVGIIINSIYSNVNPEMGFWAWIAILLYPLQMYADFSGCMDIVIGTAEIFDIKLAENFNNPFFSKTTQEFWQRWHITLGTWAKDYVLYPLLKSGPIVRLGKKSKKRFGKRVGKLIPLSICMFALWMVMGLWHGAWKYVIGVSLWYWAIQMLGEIFGPQLEGLAKALKVNKEAFSWHFFQSVRTYFIYAIGAVFFRARSIKQAVKLLGYAGMTLVGINSNPWIFFDNSLLETGVLYADLNVVVLGIVMLVIVAILREKYGYARVWIDRQNLVFRWAIWLSLLAIVMVYGVYGPGYDASSFIYGQF